MATLVTFWNRLGSGARLRFGASALLVVLLAAWLGYRAMQVDYDVLFTQLAEGDAATIVARLKQQKMPYRLADGGTTIEVPATQVHETRLRLMSDGVPLAGGVGFEIFDKQGLGATEQSQRVSYQRALQGELARTISTISDVKQVRIHLVLPENTLFKRDRQEARAAVTLLMRPGAVLAREQISGIQRLVAASVAGLDAGKVVVTDQRGITLSGPDSLGDGAAVSEAHLAMKREIEDYVARKVAHLLDSTYGPGQAIVSVDVALNFDEIRRTVQDLQPSGVRRKRQVLAGGPASSEAAVLPADSSAAPPNSTTEVEYEYGHRVEQVIAAPGGITRISIGVIVPGSVTPEKQQRITDLVRMAAGIDAQRGDAIVVQALDQLGARPFVPPENEVVPAATAVTGDVAIPRPSAAAAFAVPQGSWMLLVVVPILLLALLLTRRRIGRTRAIAHAPLSPQERQRLLLEIEDALGSGTSMSGARAKS